MKNNYKSKLAKYLQKKTKEEKRMKNKIFNSIKKLLISNKMRRRRMINNSNKKMNIKRR